MCGNPWGFGGRFALIAALMSAPFAYAGTDGLSSQSIDPALIQHAQAISDAVLTHDIDPPVRQQMYLAGLQAAYRRAEQQAPSGLAVRASAAATPEQLAQFLRENWPASQSESVSASALTEAFLQGMLKAVPGNARLLETKEAKVAEQLENNRYVGIQVALGFENTEKQAVIMSVLEGGPAQRAGIAKGDRVLRIDGVDIRGLPLKEVVDRLRGALGTQVEIEVKPAGASESRTHRLTREMLARSTISQSGGGLATADRVGYIKIEQITPSTPHEIRLLAVKLENEGFQALILDLRGTVQATVHSTVLVADCFLSEGAIGRLRTADRVETYVAESDVLFRDWPMAVLVDQTTAGPAEWLAAALNDNHRARLFGSPTAGQVIVNTTVPLQANLGSLWLATGRLERGDGRTLDRFVASLKPSIVPAKGHHQSLQALERGPSAANGQVVPLRQQAAANDAQAGQNSPQPTRESEVQDDAPLTEAAQYLRELLHKSKIDN